jgi:hypothetical protein
MDMDPNKEEREEFDIKKMFEELRVDDLNTEFEKTFERITLRKRIQKGVLISVAVGLLSFLAIKYFDKKEEILVDENPQEISENSVKNSDYKLNNDSSERTHQPMNTISKSDDLEQQSQGHGDLVFDEVVQNQEIGNDLGSGNANYKTEDSHDQIPENTNSGNQKPNNDNAPNAEKNPCEGVLIDATFNTIPSCNTQDDGEITVNQTKGGKAPYSYLLDATESKNGSFKYLSPKTYKLTVKDANKCTSTVMEIEVQEQTCADDYNLVYSFEKDNEVKIPVQEGDLLKILDARGNVVLQERIYQTEFVFHPNNLNGVRVNEGLYIMYVQGVNGKVQKFEVTIMP